MPGISEVLHAEFHEHAYPPHTHDTWTVFVVDDGQIRYDLDRHHRGRRVFDGRRAPTARRSRRPPRNQSWLPQARRLPGDERPGRGPDRPRRRRAVRSRMLRCAVASTFCTGGFVTPIRRSRRRPTSHSSPSACGAHLADQRDEDRPRPRRRDRRAVARPPRTAGRSEAVTLAAAGRDPSEPAPASRSLLHPHAFGIAPHAYVLGRRIEAAPTAPPRWGTDRSGRRARRLLRPDLPLTRHFKRHVGTTPGRFGDRDGDGAMANPEVPDRQRHSQRRLPADRRRSVGGRMSRGAGPASATSTGRKSGKSRTNPLLYTRTGDAYVVSRVEGWRGPASALVSEPAGEPRAPR